MGGCAFYLWGIIFHWRGQTGSKWAYYSSLPFPSAEIPTLCKVCTFSNALVFILWSPTSAMGFILWFKSLLSLHPCETLHWNFYSQFSVPEFFTTEMLCFCPPQLLSKEVKVCAAFALIFYIYLRKNLIPRLIFWTLWFRKLCSASIYNNDFSHYCLSENCQVEDCVALHFLSMIPQM